MQHFIFTSNSKRLFEKYNIKPIQNSKYVKYNDVKNDYTVLNLSFQLLFTMENAAAAGSSQVDFTFEKAIRNINICHRRDDKNIEFFYLFSQQK